jgi:hypothetical protein
MFKKKADAAAGKKEGIVSLLLKLNYGYVIDAGVL